MKSKATKYLSGNVILPEKQNLGALVLGDCNSAIDLAILKPNHVQTIISIGLEAQPPKHKLPEDVQHHVFDIHDNKQQKIPVELFDQVYQLIEQGRQRAGVLVHCYAGVSRSSSFVIAYLIRKFLLSYDDAKQKAKKHRSCIHPGDGFVRQLQYYAKVIFKREQERLAAMNKHDKPVEKVEPIQQIKQLPLKNESLTKSERLKRGVRGAVRSAEHFSPQKGKSSVMQKSELASQKIEQTEQEQNILTPKKNGYKNRQRQGQKYEEKSQKLPPIHRDRSEAERYQRSSSRIQIKDKIEKIEGRQSLTQAPSIRGIYGGKTKIM